MTKSRDRIEKMVAMTTLHPHMDGAAIFNPLVDAPPEPPPLPSYQHSTPYHHGTSTTPSGSPSSSLPKGDLPTEPNYYYSSSMPPVLKHQHQPHSYHSAIPTFYDLDLQHQHDRRRDLQKQHRSCRVLALMGFLYILVLSWKRHWQYDHHDEHPKPFLPIMMNFGNHLLDKPRNADDLVDTSGLVGVVRANNTQDDVGNSTMFTNVTLNRFTMNPAAERWVWKCTAVWLWIRFMDWLVLHGNQLELLDRVRLVVDGMCRLLATLLVSWERL